MNTNPLKHDPHETPKPTGRRFSIRGFLSNISTTWKMTLMFSVLLLGILGITVSAYIGLTNIQYQLSNIYDFMLVPIVAINKADVALADSQNDLVQSYNQTLSASQRAGYTAHFEADTKTAQDVITQYDNEWVTTVSPDFTKALRQAGKLDLQKQELTALADFHTAFAAYQQTLTQYVATTQTGRPNVTLANQASTNLEQARQHLQELIDINNQYADLSNTMAKAAYQQALVTSGIVLFVVIALGAIMSYLIANIITSRLGELTRTALALQQGNLDQTIHIIGHDELTTLGAAFNSMAAQLKNSFATLENRVAERTANLELAATVGRSVSQVRALDVMLKDAAELIRSQFDLYYAQVYLTNPSQTELILQAGTGAVGTELLNRGHRLPLNTASINGRAAVEKRAVVISDTAASATFHPNPLLPDTRSEMAVPLMVGDKVVGVLDLQSHRPGVINQDILPAFEALAGQLAIAIQNASLLAEAEQARAEVEKQAQRLVRTNWEDYLDAVHKPEQTGFVFEGSQVNPLTQAEETSATDENKAIVAPIAITGEALGKLVVELDEQNQTNQNAELVQAVARQVAQQIESLRLLDSAERYRYEAEQASRRQTLEGWQEFFRGKQNQTMGYLYDLNQVKPVVPEATDAQVSALSLPIKVRDATMGTISVLGMGKTDTQTAELVEEVTQRLSAHLDNLRLSQQTQERAFREQALRQFTSAVRASNNAESILRTAVREVGNLLGRRTIVRMATAEQSDSAESGNGHQPGEPAASSQEA